MQERFSRTAMATAEFTRQGILIFSPILHSVPMVELGYGGTTWEHWADYDTAFIKKCKQVFVLQLDGWKQSRGVTAEIEICRANGIPVIGVNPLDIEEAVQLFVARRASFGPKFQ
jgi:hypothetical protein